MTQKKQKTTFIICLLLATLIRSLHASLISNHYASNKLIDSAQQGNLENVKYYLSVWADVNAKNKWGNTALIYSAEKGHIEVVKHLVGQLLVEHGADINKKDVESSALDCAAALGHIEIVVYLVNKGAHINIKNKNGNTPLHSAIMFNRNRVVKYLLSKKALTIPYNENGKHVYVYELAIRCYADESYKELQKYASTLF